MTASPYTPSFATRPTDPPSSQPFSPPSFLRLCQADVDPDLTECEWTNGN